jgi:hypothetical protein
MKLHLSLTGAFENYSNSNWSILGEMSVTSNGVRLFIFFLFWFLVHVYGNSAKSNYSCHKQLSLSFVSRYSFLAAVKLENQLLGIHVCS